MPLAKRPHSSMDRVLVYGTRDLGSNPSGVIFIISENDGAFVQREDNSFARNRWGFDFPRLHSDLHNR